MKPAVLAAGLLLAFCYNLNAQAVYTHTATTEDIISFDWDSSGNLYYLTSGNAFWRANTLGGGMYAAPATPLYSDAFLFAGLSVVTIGDSIYFNNSEFFPGTDQNIWEYSIPGNTVSATPVSTDSNALLGSNGTSLFASGSGVSDNNHLYQWSLGVNGTWTSSSAVDLGGTGSGFSGPLAFDGAGNLYYAPGFGDFSIYQWSNAQVSDAFNSITPLSIGSAVASFNYATALGLDVDGMNGDDNTGGGSGITFDAEGDLILSLNFDSFTPSPIAKVVEFDPSLNGTFEEQLNVSGRLGDVGFVDGESVVAQNNQIVLVPEPSTGLLLLLAGFGVILRRRYE